MCFRISHQVAFFSGLVFWGMALSSANNVNAQPAPTSYTDRIITETPLEAVSEATQEVVLQAYREAAAAKDWPIPEQLQVLSVQAFFIPDGDAMQVHVRGHDLGNDGVLFITTADPRVFQRMKQEDLVNYGGKSAFFPAGNLTIAVIGHANGSSTNVELERIRVLNDSPTAVIPMALPTTKDELRRTLDSTELSGQEDWLSSEVEDLCGPDNRDPSDDKRVGRLMPVGCTGWLIGNDLALTAGHCDVGEQMDIIEFQVPQSAQNGDTKPANPDDQYPVIKASIKKQYTGIGDDWAVFRIGPNSNTGKLPGVQQGGYFKLSRRARPATAKVTGFGVDDTPPGPAGGRNQDNQTQQTEDGEGSATVSYFESNGQHGSYFRYTADTKGGNSGSPVFAQSDGAEVAIAIHTNAGCETGGNHGTALDNEDLRDAIRQFVADLSTVYVDETESPTPELAIDPRLEYRKKKSSVSK